MRTAGGRAINALPSRGTGIVWTGAAGPDGSDCPEYHVCVWKGPNFTGKRTDCQQLNVCVNVSYRSIRNQTSADVELFAEPDCRNEITVLGNTEIGDPNVYEESFNAILIK